MLTVVLVRWFYPVKTDRFKPENLNALILAYITTGGDRAFKQRGGIRQVKELWILLIHFRFVFKLYHLLILEFNLILFETEFFQVSFSMSTFQIFSFSYVDYEKENIFEKRKKRI